MQTDGKSLSLPQSGHGAQHHVNMQPSSAEAIGLGKREAQMRVLLPLFPRCADADKQRGRKWLSNSYNLKTKLKCMRMCIATDIKYIPVLLRRAD